MILPDKHLPLDRALLAGGAAVLSALTTPMTVSAVWERVRVADAVTTFDRFVLAVDLLFSLGLLEMREGNLARTPR